MTTGRINQVTFVRGVRCAAAHTLRERGGGRGNSSADIRTPAGPAVKLGAARVRNRVLGTKRATNVHRFTTYPHASLPSTLRCTQRAVKWRCGRGFAVVVGSFVLSLGPHSYKCSGTQRHSTTGAVCVPMVSVHNIACHSEACAGAGFPSALRGCKL